LPLAQHLLVTHGLHLITRLRKQTHKRLLDLSDKRLLRKRATIETIHDQLKNMCQIKHSCYRNPINFLLNLVAGLLAYCH
jgi:DDE family transposase